MEIVYLLAPLALILALGAIAAFLWAVNKGQYDDLETPAHRMLLDENEEKIEKDQRKTSINKKE